MLKRQSLAEKREEIKMTKLKDLNYRIVMPVDVEKLKIDSFRFLDGLGELINKLPIEFDDSADGTNYEVRPNPDEEKLEVFRFGKKREQFESRQPYPLSIGCYLPEENPIIYSDFPTQDMFNSCNFENFAENLSGSELLPTVCSEKEGMNVVDLGLFINQNREDFSLRHDFHVEGKDIGPYKHVSVYSGFDTLHLGVYADNRSGRNNLKSHGYEKKTE